MTTLHPTPPASDAGALVALASSSSEIAHCAAALVELPLVNGQAPEWIELLPVGAVKPTDGREPWTLSDPSAVIAASLAAAPHRLIGIDYDHAMDLAAPKGLPAPAAGWITALEQRGGAIWAKVDWTKAGAQAIAAREYRFVSPSFRFTADGRVITRIDGAGLVNRPALPQLTALASSQGDIMDPRLKALLDALGLAETADQPAILTAVGALKSGAPVAALCSAAGVPADSTADQLVQAVTALKATADSTGAGLKAIAAAAGLDTAATADLVASTVKTLKTNASTATILETQVATLSERLQSLEGDKLGASVDAAIAAGKFVPAQRTDLLALAASNRDAFDRLVSNAVPVLKPGEQGHSGTPAAGELTADEKAVCAAMGLSPEAFKAQRKKEA